MGALEFCRLLDRRLIQHQHLDDLVFDDHWWSVLVAVVALRMDRVLHLRLLRVHDRTDRRNLPRQLPGHLSCFIWYMGFLVASVQQSCHGLCKSIVKDRDDQD